MKALIFKKYDRGEHDEIVLFLGRNLGWARGVAKNAKKSRIRFGGHLEPFSLVELSLRPRKKDDLVWIDDSQVINGFLGLRNDLKKFALISYFMEAASIFSPEGQPDNILFEFLVLILEILNSEVPSDLTLFLFELELLKILGFAPVIISCVICGKVFVPGESARFDPIAGGSVHQACEANPKGDDLKLSPNTLATLINAFDATPDTVRRIKLSRKSAQELRAALGCYVRSLRGREINSLVFLEHTMMEIS